MFSIEQTDDAKDASGSKSKELLFNNTSKWTQTRQAIFIEISITCGIHEKIGRISCSSRTDSGLHDNSNDQVDLLFWLY
jgi:hypothetical protein